MLPDHLHAIWKLPDGEADFGLRWRLIKARFSRELPQGERVSPSRSRKGERGIWQRRYWEHTLRDEGDFARHVDYIHFNPVEHGHVGRVRDWHYSSFHNMVRLGLEKVVYIGVIDGRLATRIRRHLIGISISVYGTAPRYREWAEGKQITIVAYKPQPIRLLNLDIQIHRAIEADLIKEFRRPGEPDWFVIRTQTQRGMG